MSRHHRKTSNREWDWIRLKVLQQRDGRRCQECHKAGRLEVHHLKQLQDGGDNALDNLKTLCRDCHIRAHARPVSAGTASWQFFVDELK